MSYGILPIKDTKSCGVCADKSADKNVADVPSGDLISRQLIIGAIEKCGEEKIYPQALIEVIKAIPSADVVSREEYNKLLNDLIWESEHIGKLMEYQTEVAEPSKSVKYKSNLLDTNGEVSDMAGDIISRADVIEVGNKIVEELSLSSIDWDDLKYWAKELFDSLPSAEPKGANLINRHDATEVIREECLKCNNLTNDDLFMRIMSLPTSQQTDCTDFIMWLIDVVLDEEDWELNAVGYGEIIARQLKKLGLLEVKDGYYIRSSAEQVTSKLKNPCDSLLTEDLEERKEQKSKLDLISRAEAIEAIQNAYCKPCKERGDDHNEVRCRVCEYDNAIIQIDALPSADRPKVIKSKTLMPTKDFKEWAKRIREVNPNAVVIPCDAEVISADRQKGEWIEVFDFVHLAWECSKCGAITSVMTPFCYECGADMRPEI